MKVSVFLLSGALACATACKEQHAGSQLADSPSNIFSDDAFLNPEVNLVFQADKPVVPVPDKNPIPKIHIVNGTNKQFDALMWFNQRALGDTEQKTKQIGDFTVSIDDNGLAIVREVKWPVPKEGEVIEGGIIMPWQGDLLQGPKRFAAGEVIIWGRRGDAPTQLKLFDPTTAADITSQFQLDFNKNSQVATIVDAPGATTAQAAEAVSTQPEATTSRPTFGVPAQAETTTDQPVTVMPVLLGDTGGPIPTR